MPEKEIFKFLQAAHQSNLEDLYCVYILFSFSLSLRSAEQSASGATPQGLNTLSIAEITGIPRETVRRKLKILMEKELIVQGPTKTYLLNNPNELADWAKPLMRLATAQN